MRTTTTATLIAIALAATACTGRDAPADTASPATMAAPAPATIAPATTATTAPPPASMALPGTPATTLPAASATVAAPAATGPMPAEGAITFDGFGPAHWGASEEQIRQAWGKDLEGGPTEPESCHYLFPQPRSQGGYRLAFMVEGGKFSRIDVRAPEIVAPGGGRVGMDKAALLRLYPGISEQKHKYVEGGLNLRGMDPAGGQGVIVFELDPAGKATAWRVGVPPQVDYVEGCS